MPRPAKTSQSDTLEATLQANIVSYRKLRGLTQQALADLIGLSRSGLADIESGKNKVYGEVLARLAQSLGVSTDILLGLQASDIADLAPSLRLVRRFQEIEKLPDAKRKYVLRAIDDLLKANINTTGQ